MRHAGVMLLLIAIAGQVSPVRADVDYTRDVKPLLEQHCYRCHGALQQKSGLRLDHISFLRQGGDRGPALAETGAESGLVQAVDGSGDVEQMPLEAKPLTDDEIALLRQWVDAGARRPTSPCPRLRRPIGRFKHQCVRRCRR